MKILIAIAVMVLGIIIGFIIYFLLKKRNNQKEEVNDDPQGRPIKPEEKEPQKKSEESESKDQQEFPGEDPLQPGEKESEEYDDFDRSFKKFPYKVIGSKSGTWFQVIDDTGKVYASYGEPDTDYSFEADCGDGEVEYIGIRKTDGSYEISSVGCVYQGQNGIQRKVLGDKENTSYLYSVSNEYGCPINFQTWKKNNKTKMSGITTICSREEPPECTVQKDCPQGYSCSKGKCIEITDF